ncbi:putative spanin [Escherichia phage vB-EcoS-XT34]|nr:putative spanin [Escherichia phage vB-EcoS-XT34]
MFLQKMLLCSVILLSGCSATSALTGLIGSKPEISAQAGAENVKQTVGVTGKVDKSNDNDTTIKDSKVGKVDTSNGKSVSTSSIKADTIVADKIEIRNDEGGGRIAFGLALILISLLLFSFTIWTTFRKK